MNNPLHKQTSLSICHIFFGVFFITAQFSALYPCSAIADIYRFVTIDGVETFTDAPVSKNAKVVIKDTSRKTAKTGKSVPPKKQRTEDISLDDIVTKTVQAHLPEPSQTVEPRLPAVGGSITSPVGMRIDPIDHKWRQHNGIDIAIPEGTPVPPAAPGVVVFSGMRPGYGYTVLVEHDNGMVSLYGHNSRLMVTEGQRVDADTTLALSGNTGRSTGPHLHFEAWQAGVNVTPAFMPGSTAKLPVSSRVASASKPQNHFRREILSDGTVLFTNLPANTP